MYVRVVPCGLPSCSRRWTARRRHGPKGRLGGPPTCDECRGHGGHQHIRWPQDRPPSAPSFRCTRGTTCTEGTASMRGAVILGPRGRLRTLARLCEGPLRSTRRPVVWSIRSTRSRTWPSFTIVVVSSERPRRATNARPGSLVRVSRPRVVQVASRRTEAGDRVVHARAAVRASGRRDRADVSARWSSATDTSSMSRRRRQPVRIGSRLPRCTSSQTSASTWSNAVRTKGPPC